MIDFSVPSIMFEFLTKNLNRNLGRYGLIFKYLHTISTCRLGKWRAKTDPTLRNKRGNNMHTQMI